MSLINQMLRDLAGRSQDSPELLAQVKIHSPEQEIAAAHWGRTFFFIGMVAAFTVLFLFQYGRRVARESAASAPAMNAALLAAAQQVRLAGAAVPVTAPAPAFELEQQLGAQADAGYSSEVLRRIVPAPPPRLILEDRLASKPVQREMIRPAAGKTRNSSRRAPSRALPLLERAREAQVQGETLEAERLYREALVLDPDLLSARSNLAALLLDQARLEEADEILTAGYERNPAWEAYITLRARLELARDRPETALQFLQGRPAPAMAGNPEYHALLANVYQRLKRHAEAVQIYSDLLRLRPRQSIWWVGYAISLEGAGNRESALAAYTRGLQLGRLDPRLQQYAASRSAALREELKD